MNLLLDTHTFLWWISESTRLSQKVFELIQNADNTLLLSLVSVWEMQIKKQRGKLEFQVPLAEIIQTHQEKSRMIILPITLEHILALDTLPFHHKDPFDRLLIAQASVEQAALVTHDPVIAQYPVQTIW